MIDDFFKKQFAELEDRIVERVGEMVKKLLPAAGHNPDEVVWLSPVQARELLGLKSRKVWKDLRMSGEIHYTKSGREFRYSRQSLVDFLTRRSTMRYSLEPVSHRKISKP